MDDHDKSDEAFIDSWSRFTPIERECIQHLDHDGTVVDRELHQERDAVLEKLWATFQETASCLAHLYKEQPSRNGCNECNSNRNHERYWQPFQGAANKVTLLYRDGSEGIRAGYECGYRAGYKKRGKDLTSWLKKKKRTLRREDILLNLAGRSPPRRKLNERTISPELVGNDHTEFDFLSDPASRLNDARKRHTEFNFLDAPHKRSKYS